MPTEMFNEAAVLKELSKLKMKENESPAAFTEKLALVSEKYRTTTFEVQEELLVSIFIGALPSKYAGVILKLKETKGSKLALDDIEEETMKYYELTQGMTQI